MPNRTPSYRHHKPSGQAVVTLNGRDHYLGEYGTNVSRATYDRLIAMWLSNGRRLGTSAPGGADLTVTEVIAAYWSYAKRYYVKNGMPTDEQAGIKQALRPLRRLFGDTSASDFGPLALKTVREAMVEMGWCRTHINKNVGRLKRMFRWAVENELVAPSLDHALQAVRGLAKGRTALHGARESDPVKPVCDAHVDAIRPCVCRQVWAMIELQQLTGMRPGEVCIIRGCDLNTTGDMWEYRPATHKTEHFGQDRIVLLGPRAQKVVREYMKTDMSLFLFSPEDAEAERNTIRRANRRSPMTPSQAKRRPAQNRKRRPQDHYITDSYRRAIQRGCDKAFPAPESVRGEALKLWRREHRWHPNQLRHGSGTKVRQMLGLEAAQVWLGHSKADVTQIYAERNLDLARQVAKKIG